MSKDTRPERFTVVENLKNKRFEYLPRYIRKGEKMYACVTPRKKSTPARMKFVTLNPDGRGQGYDIPDEFLSSDRARNKAAA